MSTGLEQQLPRERSVLYVVVVIVLVILAVWGMIAFRSARENQRAQEKATELVQVLEAAGSTAPRPEVKLGQGMSIPLCNVLAQSRAVPPRLRQPGPLERFHESLWPRSAAWLATGPNAATR